VCFLNICSVLSTVLQTFMLQLLGIRFEICTFSTLVISSAAYFHLDETTNIQHHLDVISSSITELSLFATLCFIKCKVIALIEIQDVVHNHTVYSVCPDVPSMVGETP
jgi:hypothetical protein